MTISPFALRIISGPIGAVDDDRWPHIAYVVALDLDGKEIWRGDYRLGVGHVKVRDLNTWAWPEQESILLRTWQSKPQAQFKDKQLWANVAAKLAKAQKVVPNVDDVTSSLLSEGAAYFDAVTFKDWASDLGYSDDSIKAKAIYEACDTTGRQLQAHLGAERIAQLREAFQDY